MLTSTTGLTAGVEGFGERARSTYITGEEFQEVPIERQTFGVFSEVRQDLGARATFSVGLRADSIRRDALEGNPDPSGRDRPSPTVGDLGEPASGRALHRVAGQRGAARTTVRASYGTGIRPPDAFELAFTDNPDLQPERSRSADIGVSHVLVPQVTLDATVFFNRYDDLIVAVGRRLPTPAATAPTTSPTPGRAGWNWRAPGAVRAACTRASPTPSCPRRSAPSISRPTRRRRSRSATR